MRRGAENVDNGVSSGFNRRRLSNGWLQRGDRRSSRNEVGGGRDRVDGDECGREKGWGAAGEFS